MLFYRREGLHNRRAARVKLYNYDKDPPLTKSVVMVTERLKCLECITDALPQSTKKCYQ